MDGWKGSVENMDMTIEFWKGKKVLVTGHTGFKGSWLSLWLQKMGAEVVGVSLEPSSRPNIYQKAHVKDGMISIYQDIRDGEKLKELFEKHKPEVLFHLAAQPLVRYSYREPVETYETNVMGTLHILEAMRNSNTVRSAVIVTTDKCYKNREWEWGYREDEPMGGHDPYSSSKGAVELLISSYRNSYYPVDKYLSHKTAIASARAGNVIGGGDWAEDRLIPDIIRAFQRMQPVQIRNPLSIRPWQHVLDPLHGYLKLAECLYQEGALYSEAWNFGPLEGDVKSVQWIVNKMIKKWEKGADYQNDFSIQHPHEANYLKLDCSKAHNRLDWWPIWSLNDALNKIIEWHQSEEKGLDMRQVSLEQIDNYLELNGEKNE
jgi:CDP-glucose 4,6-dehydratase